MGLTNLPTHLMDDILIHINIKSSGLVLGVDINTMKRNNIHSRLWLLTRTYMRHTWIGMNPMYPLRICKLMYKLENNFGQYCQK